MYCILYNDVRFIQLFVGGLMSYLRYLYFFAYSGVQHILYCVFILFVFVLCLVYPMLLIFLVFCVVLLCVFTFWVLCCDVWYDFRIKRCSVRVYIQLLVGGSIFVLCFCFVFLLLVYSMLPVSPYCPFWLALLYSLTFICQFLWIVPFDCL